MGRHSPRLSPAQRYTRLALGATTVLMLLAAVWAMGRGGAGEAPPLTTDTTSPPVFATLSTASSTTSSSSTTTVPTTLVTSSTQTSLDPASLLPSSSTTTTLAPLVLRPDGLGAVDFGIGSDEVITAVVQRLGAASSDSGWAAARGDFGTCPGTVVRVMRWDSLRLFFSDGPTDFAEEGRHFFYYSQSTVDAEVVLDLATPEDIEIGSTVEELEATYGDRLTIDSTISFGVTFVVEPPGPGLLAGTLTASAPDGMVTSIGGGFGCGG